MMAALLLPGLLGMAALAIDLGSYASERRNLQNAADSIALAAGSQLPDSSSATAAGSAWAAKNGIPSSEMSISIDTASNPPTVTVTLTRSHEFAFIRVLGIDEKDVGARAVAGKFSPAVGTGIVPWSITQSTVDSSVSGDEIVIKYDSNGDYGEGNFGAIRIDGSGGSDYEEAAMYGSEYQICSQAMPNCSASNCPGSYPSSCAETSPECDGSQCQPKTGNMTGPTQNAVDFRMNNTSDGCEDFDDVFYEASASTEAAHEVRLVSAGPVLAPPSTATSTVPVPTSTPGAATSTPSGPTNTPAATTTVPAGSGPTYAINQECNPWTQGACPPGDATAQCSRRVFMIPIIDDFGTGSSTDSVILGFALVFLEGYDNGACGGSSCEIKARFVKADITTGALAESFDPDSNVHFVKLIE